MTRAEEIEDRESRITEAARLRRELDALRILRLGAQGEEQAFRDELRMAEIISVGLQDQIAQLESELQAVTP